MRDVTPCGGRGEYVQCPNGTNTLYETEIEM